MTLEDMLKTSRKGTVVIVQADHEDSLQAMEKARKEGIARFILIGDPDRIHLKARQMGIPVDGMDIRLARDDKQASEMAAMMAESGEAEVVMKGLVHTSVFTRALLNKERGLIPQGGLISHVALFDLPGLPHPVFLSDAALNILPSLDEKAVILRNAISVAWSLGIEKPAVACIAPVEQVNPKIQSTVDAAKLQEMDMGEAIVEGPLALDVVLSREAADIKGIKSRVAGHPDILLFPELNSANGVYKAFAFQPNSRCAGILAGLRVPVVLTSRSDSEQTRYNSLKLALAAARD